MLRLVEVVNEEWRDRSHRLKYKSIHVLFDIRNRVVFIIMCEKFNYTHTHTHTRTHAHTDARTLTYTRSRTHTHSVTIFLSLTHLFLQFQIQNVENIQPHKHDYDTFLINVFFKIYLLYSVRVRVNVLYLMDACYRNKTMA